MENTMTIFGSIATANVGVACRERAYLPLLASARDRFRGTGLSTAGFGGADVRPDATGGAAVKVGVAVVGAGAAPTQLTSMDVVHPERGRPPV